MNDESKAAIAEGGIKLIKWAFYVGVAWVCWSLVPVGSFRPTDGRRTMARYDLTRLKIAMKGYYTEFERWPPIADLYPELMGKNSRGIPFLEINSRSKLPWGTPLDPWFQHYVYDGIVNDEPRFHSIGKDGIDQHGAKGSDDIISWTD
jgi:hypothetical protein